MGFLKIKIYALRLHILEKLINFLKFDSLILVTAVYLKYNHFCIFDKDFKILSDSVIEETLVYYLE